MRGIIITLFCLVSLIVLGQNDLQYKNKDLEKVLLKNGIPNFTSVEELKIDEAVKDQYKIQGKFFEIKSDASQYKYIYTGRVNSCRAGGCSIASDTPHNTESEYFDYFILFDQDKTVQLVKVFNYQATHGHEVTAKGWLKQFRGYNGSEPLEIDKNIDAISGATISVYAITFDIETKIKILNSFNKELVQK